MTCNLLRRAALALLLAATPLAAPAKIDLVTLPASDGSELTIYNSADLTLVRETRTLSFREGRNEIQFSWANTLIDPTSLRINVDSAPGLVVEDAVYPTNTRDLILWNITAEAETSAAVEISYFTSGLSWAADYVVKANADETALAFQQFITVTNNSGEDFENVTTRVVVGQVNLMEQIADLARRGMLGEEYGRMERDDAKDMRKAVGRAVMQEMVSPFAAAPAASVMLADGLAEAREIVRKAVSEYHIFAVEGKESIANGWGKKLPMPVIEGVKFDLSYEIEPNKYGPTPQKFYKWKNSPDHEMGTAPLPDGGFYVYSDDGRKGLRFEGNMHHRYVPIGEDVELNLGSDGMVLFEERLIETKRESFDFDSNGDIIGWIDRRVVELELRNARTRAVPLKLTHYLGGDWEFVDVSRKDYEKISREAVRWEFSLDPGKTVIRYDVKVRQGSLARN